MTREQLIKQAANEYMDNYVPDICGMCLEDIWDAFIAGAEWANKHPDLSSLWHDPSEEPQGYEYKVICDSRYGTLMWDPSMLTEYSWREYTRCWAVSQWAYVNDLIPK